LGKTLDVSEGGVRIEAHVSMDKGTRVSLTVAFGDELVDLEGRVVHSVETSGGRFEYGIEFVEMDERSTDFLRQYKHLLGEDDG